MWHLNRDSLQVTGNFDRSVVMQQSRKTVVLQDPYGACLASSQCSGQRQPKFPIVSSSKWGVNKGVFVRSERAGQRVMASIRNFLEERMRLQVNEEKSGVRKPEEVAFLGFRLRCSKEGDTHVAVCLSRKAERRLKATIREMTPPNWGRSITFCVAGISRYLNGWMTHFRLCTPEAVEGPRVIDAHVRRRVRAIIVRQRKRDRFLFRYLVRRGVSRKAAANCVYRGKRAWVKSNRPAMTRA